jgi:6-phosphogluconolactonase/glucosamine-6-phosphate isomerase/deaminase
VKIEVYPDEDIVARMGAAVIAADMRAAVSARGRYVLAVSGGHTPWQMLRALADKPLPWQQVLWLVTGADKAAKLARLRDGDRAIPASRVRRDGALLLADRAAAARLGINEEQETQK